VTDRSRLAELTGRWRARHDARRPQPESRPLASPEREALAAAAFPFRAVTPAEYVAAHGGSMAGFTFDEERMTDAMLDAWLLEVGRLLRAAR
jgi:hypothetical protein